MKMNKNRIFNQDWLDFHPYKQNTGSDLYYVQLSNKVMGAINTQLAVVEDIHYLALDEEANKRLSCILTAYFEDIISLSNIWNAFVRECKSQTGNWLPFYDTTDYAEEEINEVDIQFLCWHFFSQQFEARIPISPTEQLFEMIAHAVYAIFDAEYETAPENKKLKEFFQLNEEEGNLFELQSRFFWLGTESYLFCFNSRDLENELNEVVEVTKEYAMEDNMAEMVDMVMTDFSFNNVTEFFNLTAAQWLAKVLGDDNQLYAPLMELSRKKTGHFIFQEQDSMYAHFRHVATGNIIPVTNRSLTGYPKNMKSPEVIVFAGFVEWQGEWWFIGDLRGYDVDQELIEEISAREEELNLFNEDKNLEETTTEAQDQSAAAYLTETKEDLLKEEFEDEIEEATAIALNEGEAFEEISVDVETDWDEEDQLDLEWALLFHDELTNEYLEESILNNKYASLHFPGDNGKTLMDENLRFTLSYFRR